MVFVPVEVEASEQEAAATVAVHWLPLPSSTVTLPVGVPLPGDLATTV